MPNKKQKPVAENISSATDPLSVNIRLYRQISQLLTQLEQAEDGLTIRERVAALVAIGRIQVLFVNLRKEKFNDAAIAGSKVRKYATSFKAHDARRRAAAAGPTEPEQPSELDGLFDDDSDDADTA
jgi:hypothetical protein